MRIMAGTARGRRIEAPPGRDTRPTLDRVRENLFNMLQDRVVNARVLDPFAGSGALSLEALSRGAAFAVLGDRDRTAHRVELKNIETLGFQNRTRVLLSEWQRTLERLRSERDCFDLVFLDPPYAMQDLTDVFDMLKDLLTMDAWVIVEHEAKAVIRAGQAFNLVKSRSWGYCGVSFYSLSTGEKTEGEEESVE